jgi:hypothetical protein
MVDILEKIKGNEINDLIELFKPINPSYERLFRNKTERDCIKRLINKYGYDDLKEMIEKLPEIVTQQYAPVITTPYQFEMKIGQLLIFLERKKKDKYRVIDCTNIPGIQG